MIAHQLFDANCRIEGMWPLPNGEIAPSMLEALEDREGLEAKFAPYLEGWAKEEISELFEGDGGSASDAWSALSDAIFCGGQQLYIVLASCPVFQTSKSGGHHFSWGYYQSDVFVSETAEAAMEQAAAWADAEYEKARTVAA